MASDDPPVCKKCSDEFCVPDGYELTDYCNPCAQEIAQFYQGVLEDIAEPMKKIMADAKAEGMVVNGRMANDLCHDANWIRDKARTALKA